MKEEVDYKRRLLSLIEDINNLKEFASMQNLKGGFRVETIERSTVSSKGQTDSIDTIIHFDDIGTLSFIRSLAEVDKDCDIPRSIFEKNHWEQVYNDFLMYLIFAKDNKDESLIDPSNGEVIRCVPVRTLLKEGYKNN